MPAWSLPAVVPGLPLANRLRAAWPVLLFGLAYGLAARAGLEYSTIASNVTLIWPPSGLSLFVLLRFGFRFWPGIVLGDLLGNAGTGAPVLSVLGISAGNIAEALLVAWLLRDRLDFHLALDRVRDVVALLALGSAGAIVSAFIGPASLALGGALPWALYPKVWLQWVMGDALGVIVFAPLLLAWWQWRPGMRMRLPPRSAELAALAALLLLTCEAVFGGFGLVRQGDYAASLAIFPLAVWAALRFGLRCATAVTLVVSLAAIWATVEGRGPFAEAAGVGSLARWWVFANVITVTSLVLAASNAERDRAESELAKERDFFSAVLAVQGALVVVLDGAGRIVRANDAFEGLTGFRAAGLAGRSFAEAFAPPDQRDKVEGHLELLRVGISNRVRYEAALQRRNGDPLLISWSNTALRSAGRQLTHVILTGIDITERTQALAALRTARRELEVRVTERTRALATANADLEAEIAERRRLEREIIGVAEREQMRIGQELHDGLGQELTAVAFLAEVLEHKLAADSLPQAKDAYRIEALVSQAVSHVRLLARGLVPVELDAGGLMAALEQLAGGARDLLGIEGVFRCSDPVLVHDNSTAIHLFRIAQEAVTNAAKHSGGRCVVIELSRAASELRLSITDDGTGLGPDRSASPGIGLRTMQYRARLIGATLALSGADGRGLQVAVTLPSVASPQPHG